MGEEVDAFGGAVEGGAGADFGGDVLGDADDVVHRTVRVEEGAEVDTGGDGRAVAVRDGILTGPGLSGPDDVENAAGLVAGVAGGDGVDIAADGVGGGVAVEAGGGLVPEDDPFVAVDGDDGVGE